jgi:putative hydroxymethylpyrimidine transport system ATP-binding protein
VALARTLACECPIVLLDEPFKGLDTETKEQVYRLADRYLKDKTLLLVTHDPADAEALGCRVFKFTEGMKLLNEKTPQ